MTTTIRRASRAVPLGLTVIAASSLTGCGGDPDVAAVCVDPQTQERVSDDQCDDSDDPQDYNGGGGIGSGFFWYYLGTQTARSIPAVGSPVSGGSFNGSQYRSAGRSIQRGGLPDSGGSFKSFSKSGGFGSSKGVSSS